MNQIKKGLYQRANQVAILIAISTPLVIVTPGHAGMSFFKKPYYSLMGLFADKAKEASMEERQYRDFMLNVENANNFYQVERDFLEAISTDNRDRFEWFIEKKKFLKTNVSLSAYHPYTPLMLAVRHMRKELVERIIKEIVKEANNNSATVADNINQQDLQGNSALHYLFMQNDIYTKVIRKALSEPKTDAVLASNDRVVILEKLLNERANPNLKNFNDVTPFFMLANHSEENATSLLNMLASKSPQIDWQATDKYGNTVLGRLPRVGYLKLASMLIEKGVRPTASDLLEALKAGDFYEKRDYFDPKTKQMVSGLSPYLAMAKLYAAHMNSADIQTACDLAKNYDYVDGKIEVCRS